MPGNSEVDNTSRDCYGRPPFGLHPLRQPRHYQLPLPVTSCQTRHYQSLAQIRNREFHLSQKVIKFDDIGEK